MRRAIVRTASPETAILALAFFLGTALRVWHINHVGLNSDEAVYAGQAAAIAHVPSLAPYFGAFRAHPLLFQTLLSFAYTLGDIDLWGRLLSAAVGVATIFVTYRAATLLYGRRAGAIAALLLALMPYHVLVTRQILLDGPMTLFVTMTLYLLARYTVTQRAAWLCAAAATMGLAAISKETSLVMLGSIYAYLALTPEIRLRVRQVVTSALILLIIVAVFPVVSSLAGRTHTGGNYLAWQLFRQPNHGWEFYVSTVPDALGYLVVIAAAAGIWFLRRERSWRETLLLSWIAVPVVFFEVWPVKGYQYLLPIAPAVAILAAHALDRLGAALDPGRGRSGSARGQYRWLAPVAIAVVSASLVVPTLDRIDPPQSGELLAGSGGLPGGRETGRWIRRNVPAGAQIMTVGPSMANVIQFYGHRKAYGLAVSPNPLHRNPSYEPIRNPDRLIRDNEMQYVVWDSYSAARSSFFSRSLLRYADRYNGRAVYTFTAPVSSKDGRAIRKALIRVYEVGPA